MPNDCGIGNFFIRACAVLFLGSKMVVIFSNSDYKQTSRVLEPAGLPPMLYFSNAGCYRWTGTVTLTNTWDLGSEVATADVTMEGFLQGVMTTTPEPLYPEEIAGLQFEPISGTITWSINSTDGGGCVVTGNETFPLPLTGFDYLDVYDFALSGTWDRRIDVAGFAVDEGLEVTEQWTCDDPDLSGPFVRPLYFNMFTQDMDHNVKLSAGGTSISGNITDPGGDVIRVQLNSVRQ